MAKTSKKSAKPARTAANDAITLLMTDHRKVEDLFKKAEKAGDARKAELVKKICEELTIHTIIEEEIFYPACKEHEVESDLLDEAQVEHDGAKLLIAELQQSAPGDHLYDAKVKALSEQIKHHVKEEEQAGGLFKQARAAKLPMRELAQEMGARKKELQAAAKQGDVPAAPLQAFPHVLAERPTGLGTHTML